MPGFFRTARFGGLRYKNGFGLHEGCIVTFFRIFSVFVVSLAIAACGMGMSSTRPASAAPAAAATPAADLYRIGVDDKLQVTVWKNPELSVMVPVRPDGMISVPLIGDVLAGGMQPEEVAATIEKKLTYYIRDPKVAVIVAELRSHEFLTRVRITGAVRTPKSIPFRQGMTVLDAVLEAGGVNEFAAPNRTKVHRKVDDKTKVIAIKLDDVLTNGKLTTNIVLKPGDVVTVPERLF
jgi:polysaccharide export outer membrane protein